MKRTPFFKSAANGTQTKNPASPLQCKPSDGWIWVERKKHQANFHYLRCYQWGRKSHFFRHTKIYTRYCFTYRIERYNGKKCEVAEYPNKCRRSRWLNGLYRPLKIKSMVGWQANRQLPCPNSISLYGTRRTHIHPNSDGWETPIGSDQRNK